MEDKIKKGLTELDELKELSSRLGKIVCAENLADEKLIKIMEAQSLINKVAYSDNIKV